MTALLKHKDNKDVAFRVLESTREGDYYNWSGEWWSITAAAPVFQSNGKIKVHAMDRSKWQEYKGKKNR